LFIKSQEIFPIPHARNQHWIQFVLSFSGTVIASVAGDGKDLAVPYSGLQAHAGLLWTVIPIRPFWSDQGISAQRTSYPQPENNPDFISGHHF